MMWRRFASSRFWKPIPASSNSILKPQSTSSSKSLHTLVSKEPKQCLSRYFRIGGVQQNGAFLNSMRFGGDLKRYASASAAAEAAIESTDAEDEIFPRRIYEDDELKKLGKEEVIGRGKGKRGRPTNQIKNSKEYLELRKRQVKIETAAWEQAAKEYQELLEEMCKRKLAPNFPFVKSLFLGWFGPLKDAIVAEQEVCKKMGRGTFNTHAPYFNLLPADKMAVITMHSLMGMLMAGSEMGGARVVQAVLKVGEAIETEVRIQRFLGKTSERKKRTEDGMEPEPVTENEKKQRKKLNSLMKQKKNLQVRQLVNAHESSSPWGQENQLKVGSKLIQLLMETAFIQSPADQLGSSPPDVRPAFVQTTVRDTQKTYGVIQCDPLICKGLERTARHMVMPYMPMLVPPQNWTGYERGGHLFLPSYVMRAQSSRQQRDVIKRTSKKQLQLVFNALDTLGNTKWRVNKKLLGVIERIWINGGNLADVVDRKDKPLPEEPIFEDDGERLKWKRELKRVKKENREMHAERCDMDLKLAVARTMKNEEGFFYPHNVDFRGRAYPMHPYLNHLGSDLCRGILEFAEGKPLGSSGLRWLKIHLANLFAVNGVDKLSFDGRVAFTEQHLDDIFDSADQPLNGNRWWLKAEHPFQCLAVCINLTESLRSSSPESTLSHVPVHQDGSCNGLQHYAALGRDKIGAVAVNLVGGDKPADVYTGVANRVKEIMQGDAEKDPAIEPDALCARLLINLKQVDRKLVKQTVMTSVYGVTYRGARDQISKKLKDKNAIEDDADIFAASCYAAKVIMTALGEMFDAARGIMSWLGDCAKIIASQNQSVRWVTPVGLPVVQPYKKFKASSQVKTSLQLISLQRETDKVMVRRQRTAFPPNFVHSLDSSHMMMTAAACREAGLCFAGVHDSYWTHACDVEEMNRILREKFVELYESPILENLLQSFQESFPDLQFPPLPDRGEFDVREVLNSPYFFS